MESSAHKSIQRGSQPNSLDSVEGTFLYTVSLFGTIANATIALTVIFSRRMHQALYVLIGTLAFTDLLISMIYIPSYTYFLIQNQADMALQKENGSNGTGFNFCLVSRDLFQQMTSVTLSIKALIAIKLYAVTFLAKKHGSVFTRSRTFLYILLVWILNFAILFLPGILEFSTFDFHLEEDICHKSKILDIPYNDEIIAKYSKIFYLFVLSVHSAQVSIILFCFVKIHSAITRGKSVYWQNHSKNATQAKLHYSNASSTTCLIFTSFCLCWVPIYIVNIVDPTHQHVPRSIHHLFMDLLLLKSAINPVIYFHGFRQLRYEVKVFCLCRRREKKKSEADSTGTSTCLEGVVVSPHTSSANV